jgi:hypothetical protein
MRFFYLFCDLVFVLILKNKTCTGSDEVDGKPALVVPFIIEQDLSKQDKVAAQENSEVEKMLIESEDFCIFIEILTTAEEIFKSAKKECKKEISVNEDLIKLSKSLMNKSSWASLSHNHLNFQLFLYDCTKMIGDFENLFIKKKNYFCEIDSKVIFKIVSELREAEKRLFKALEFFEDKENSLNLSNLRLVRVRLVCILDQIKKIMKDYKKYQTLVINNMNLYEITVTLSCFFEEKLDKIKNDVLLEEKGGFKSEEVVYEHVFSTFEEILDCVEEENKLLVLILTDFDDLCTSKAKMIYTLTFLRLVGNCNPFPSTGNLISALDN